MCVVVFEMSTAMITTSGDPPSAGTLAPMIKSSIRPPISFMLAPFCTSMAVPYAASPGFSAIVPPITVRILLAPFA